MNKINRESYEALDSFHEINTKINEIIDLLKNNNILCKEEQLDDKITITLINETTSKEIGYIEGGKGQFNLEATNDLYDSNDDNETDACNVYWLNIYDDSYKGTNLGSFLLIYFILLCKKTYPDIEFIVVDDDTDELNQDKNIYCKLGFKYIHTKEIIGEDGKTEIKYTDPIMKLNMDQFLKKDAINILNKIHQRIRNFLYTKGGKRTRKSKNIKKNRKSKKNRKTKKSRKNRK